MIKTQIIDLNEASQRTGKTIWQIRGLIARGEIRWRKVGKRFAIHPGDVEALESKFWQGTPLNGGEVSHV